MYKVGDKVVIRNDLVVGTRYYMEDKVYKDTFVQHMTPSLGKTTTVISVLSGGYKLGCDYYNWTDEMIKGKAPEEKMEDVKMEFKVGDVVKNQNGKIGKIAEDDGSFFLPLRVEYDGGGSLWVNREGIYYNHHLEKITPECKFHVGDIIKGIDANRYLITDTNMVKGEVTQVFNECSIKVKVLEHNRDAGVGMTFIVDPDYFELVTASTIPAKTNLVYVEFHNREKKYLFTVPKDVTLANGDKVFVKTIHGEGVATCITNSFTIDNNALSSILAGTDLTAVKPVVGRAIEKITHECVKF